MNPILILIVEDDNDDFEEIQSRLLEAGEELEIQRTTRLNDALLLLERQMKFDLVFVDLSLPGSDSSSIYAYEVVRDLLPETPIIVLTGSQDTSLAQFVRNRGGEYLSKESALYGDSRALLARFLMFLWGKRLKENARQDEFTRSQLANLVQVIEKDRSDWRLLREEVRYLNQRTLRTETIATGTTTVIKDLRLQIQNNSHNVKLALEGAVRQRPFPRPPLWQQVLLIALLGLIWAGSTIATYYVLSKI